VNKHLSSGIILAAAQVFALIVHGYLYFRLEVGVFSSYQIWLAIVNIVFPLIVSRNETRLVAVNNYHEFLPIIVAWSRNVAVISILIAPALTFFFASLNLKIVIVAIIQALILALVHFAIHLNIREKSLVGVSILRAATIFLPSFGIAFIGFQFKLDVQGIILIHITATFMCFLYLLQENKEFKKLVYQGIISPTVFRYDLLKSGCIALMNSLARQIPLLFVNSFSNASFTADFALVQRIFNAPQSVIGVVAADFLKKKFPEGKLGEIRNRFILVLLGANTSVFFLLILLMFISSKVLEGDRIYSLLSLSILVLAPFIIRSVSSPLSTVLILKDKFSKDLIYQIVLIFITFFTFFTFDTIENYVVAFAVTTSVFYLMYGISAYKEMKSHAYN
jgi:hypothetical protein